MKKLLLINPFKKIMIDDEEIVLKDGASMHSFGVANVLKNFYDITILSPGNDEFFYYNNIKFINSGGEYNNSNINVGSASYFKKVIDFLNKDFDIILTHSGLTPFLSFLSKSLESVCVGVVHDFSAFSNEKLWINNLKDLDYLFLSNDYCYDKLVNEYGFESEKVSMVGNGVNNYKYSFKKNKKNQIIFIGRFVKSKNIVKLISVFEKLLLLEHDGLSMVIIGDGVLKTKIENYIHDNDLSDSIKVFSNISEEDKISLIQDSKVYASLSSVEGFGIPLVEAMSCGTVPVVSNIKAHRFVFQNENVGFLVDNIDEMVDKIDFLLKNEDYRSSIAVGGRRFVEDFWTWKKVAEKYKEKLSTLEKKEVSYYNKLVKSLKISLLKNLIILGYFLIDLKLVNVKNDGG